VSYVVPWTGPHLQLSFVFPSDMGKAMANRRNLCFSVLQYMRVCFFHHMIDLLWIWSLL
jgi:hypothetical protein